MSYLSDSKRALFFAHRRASDTLINKVVDSPVEINDNLEIIRMWKGATEKKPQVQYLHKDVRRSPVDGYPYWALHTHTSYVGQELEPSVSPTMWAHYHGTTPETARPFIQESHNVYNHGHYCTENSHTYLCNQDNTIYPPSVYPQAWTQVD